MTTWTFDRRTTKKLKNVFSKVTGATDIAGALCAYFTGIVGAIVCGLPSAEINFIASHADECDGKNQCLQIKHSTAAQVIVPISGILYMPFCVGERDGCCGTK